MIENKSEKTSEEYVKPEFSASNWNRVYLAVIIFTIFVISSLALFSYHFS